MAEADESMAQEILADKIMSTVSKMSTSIVSPNLGSIGPVLMTTTNNSGSAVHRNGNLINVSSIIW